MARGLIFISEVNWILIGAFVMVIDHYASAG
jgi:hypothetical protein